MTVLQIVGKQYNIKTIGTYNLVIYYYLILTIKYLTTII